MKDKFLLFGIAFVLSLTALTGNAQAPKNKVANEIASYLTQFKGQKCVFISKQDMRLYLYDAKGALAKSYPCACGVNLGDKRKRGDKRTPEGVFAVQQIQNASTWSHDFNDGKGVIAGAYGSRFVRLCTPGHSGIGIHGTHNPNSIGTRATEGCIRLKNEDIAEFAKLIEVGVPVVILTSDKDAAANAKLGARVTRDVKFATKARK